MKNESIQQEVLLMTHSSFAHSQWYRNEDKTDKKCTPEENLEEACANGLLQELLPEVFKAGDHRMYLWQMHPGFSFVQLELGELPLAFQKEFSLNPHYFLPTVWLN